MQYKSATQQQLNSSNTAGLIKILLQLLTRTIALYIVYVCKMPETANIRTICVCGAGTMGSGIAQVAAQAGFNTIQFDLNEAMLDKSRLAITASLDKLQEKGKLTAADSAATIGRLQFTSAIEQCVADVIIEAIVEDKEAKTALFKKLVSINGPQTIFATNTSSISVTALATATNIATHFAGMHFFNPAQLMKLVEVVYTSSTSTLVTDTLVALAKLLGKVPVICKDAPGFIVNRVARHYYLEAMLLVEKGLADVETIDVIMEATGFKMGPFKLMDLIGMDVNYAVSNIVWNALDKPERLKPSALQKEKVEKGELGKKSGKGFYHY